MSAVGYSIVNGTSAIALTAATARTVLGVKAHANSGLQVKWIDVCFDGVTASAVPVLVELCYATFATNAPGTQSTSLTPLQTYGRPLTVGFTAAEAWVAANEPTVLTVLKRWLMPPDKGVVMYQWPLDNEPDCALGEGFAVRCNAPAAVNVRAGIGVERI